MLQPLQELHFRITPWQAKDLCHQNFHQPHLFQNIASPKRLHCIEATRHILHNLRPLRMSIWTADPNQGKRAPGMREALTQMAQENQRRKRRRKSSTARNSLRAISALPAVNILLDISGEIRTSHALCITMLTLTENILVNALSSAIAPGVSRDSITCDNMHRRYT